MIMITHELLNLLKDSEKIDKIRGLPKILLLSMNQIQLYITGARLLD